MNGIDPYEIPRNEWQLNNVDLYARQQQACGSCEVEAIVFPVE